MDIDGIGPHWWGMCASTLYDMHTGNNPYVSTSVCQTCYPPSSLLSCRDTKIGTQLEARILRPMAYCKRLAKPLLIITGTLDHFCHTQQHAPLSGGCTSLGGRHGPFCKI
jgi:hypothetical protein